MDEKVSNWVNSLSGFKEKIKSRLPESCTEIAEKVHFNRNAGEHEMGTFKTFERPDGTLASGPEYGEYQDGGGPPNGHFGNGGEEQYDVHTGSCGKISAWQAGWNVTNAIQV